MERLSCFKAYDIRGRLGDELNETIAWRIGRAFARYLNAQTVVVGADMRLSSDGLKQALARGLMEEGCDVIDIGMVGTEEVYFATRYLDADGGIEVTASHNPKDYNGMKLVRSQSRPISGDSGLHEIRRLAEQARFEEVPPAQMGRLRGCNPLDEYVAHLLGYVDTSVLKPMTLVMNAGNGAAGHVVDAIESVFERRGVPVKFVKVHHQPDGHFPNGIPNPLLPENRAATSEAVLAHGAQMGIAWDGDFDRCFLFDERGRFIEGYYIVGLLAQAFLARHPGARIIHDPRLLWNTVEVVRQGGGVPIQSKTGHAFIKERMRAEDALYGGEMSAHHYFREFGYCDSGMIPWLLVCELISRRGQSLAQMVEQQIRAYPSSGEINFRLPAPAKSLNRVVQHYRHQARELDETDGISMSFDGPEGEWRFNLRSSNTEPVVRLNVESRGDEALMRRKTDELKGLLTGDGQGGGNP
ncbi:phosphomannomutase CpsG [Ferrimonas sediminicola]|uniref:phosphomannomutase n=1 Tax=Ferrimonas sediminicola TaxID=2569538 RepID=A0A4U1BD71_9GAMM|nr:phosphomannomutase CpsG [Ferrimonas sediminicola]TKB48195.1 phosphomannomutase CpsG [Ferrimonas sediminicola]